MKNSYNYMLLLDNGNKISLDIPQEEFEDVWAELECAMIRRGFFTVSDSCDAILGDESLSIINAGRIIGVIS